MVITKILIFLAFLVIQSILGIPALRLDPDMGSLERKTGENMSELPHVRPTVSECFSYNPFS